MTQPEIEEYHARRIAVALAHQEPTRMEKLDVQGRPGHGKQPDWLLEFASGDRWVVEITRLAVRTIREVESFMIEKICAKFTGRLPGSFGLVADVGTWPSGKIPKPLARATVDVLQATLLVGDPIESAELPPGLGVIRLDASGSVLHPLVESSSLSPSVSLDDPEVRSLEAELRSVVVECAAKFAAWQGSRRCLLIDISQSGLDWEFHGLRFKGVPQSLIDSLVQRLPKAALEVIDLILLEPGVRVSRADHAHLRVRGHIVAGTKYVDQGLGLFLQAWPGPTRPV